ncbi:PE family protein [Mycobacterium sp. Marseille-P9652]|uniref:PE family protein n=1 Tax=Mycobacterium sp. Marseille-P9652 TaxID=2654950 RepID=UPI0012E73719|nr:PE family protein [Mycobacterium sp. Marseille-P9652]
MSWVIAAPEHVSAAAADLGNIGSSIDDANAAASVPTSTVLAPGADEVSAGIAALFDAHSQIYQALSAQAAAFHAQFVQLMNTGASEYALTEAANASPLQTTEQGVLSGANSPGQALSTAQPLMSASAAPVSAASAVPSALMGVTGGSAHAAPAAVSPAAAVAPASPPLMPGATPIGAPLASAMNATGAPVAPPPPSTPLQPATPGYAPTTGEPVAALPEPTPAPVTAVPTDTPVVPPATAATPLMTSPVSAAPQSTQAYRPATPAYSTGAYEEQQAQA